MQSSDSNTFVSPMAPITGLSVPGRQWIHCCTRVSWIKSLAAFQEEGVEGRSENGREHRGEE